MSRQIGRHGFGVRERTSGVRYPLGRACRAVIARHANGSRPVRSGKRRALIPDRDRASGLASDHSKRQADDMPGGPIRLAGIAGPDALITMWKPTVESMV